MEQNKDYSLLRPFDLEAAKAGALLLLCLNDDGDGPLRYVGNSTDGKRLTCLEWMGGVNKGTFEIYHPSTIRMAPLCWVEGRPVYPGDVLYQDPYYGEVLKRTALDLSKCGRYLRFEESGSWAIDGHVSKLMWEEPSQSKQQEDEEAAAPTYSYSHDGETFHGTFASPEEAAAAYLNDMPDEESVEVGKNKQRTAHNYVSQYHIESLLEMVAESAHEDCGDGAESWLSALTNDADQLKELKQVVGDWIRRKEPPDFWRVHFIRRITRAELVASGRLDQPTEAGG